MAKQVPSTVGNETESKILHAYPGIAMWKVSDGSLVPLYNFYGTGDITATWVADPSSGNSSDQSNYEVTIGDGTTFQFPKAVRRIDGTTGELITTASSDDGNFTNIATIQFTTKIAPKAYGGSSFAKQTWSNFINQLTQGTTPVRGMELLIAAPTGQTYTDSITNSSGTTSVDGWFWMFGKITSDITHTANGDSPTDLQLTLSSYRPHGIDAEDLGGLTAITLTIPDGTQTGLSVTTPSLSSDEAAILLAGKLYEKPL